MRHRFLAAESGRKQQSSGMNANICPEAHHLPDGGAKARPEMCKPALLYQHRDERN